MNPFSARLSVKAIYAFALICFTTFLNSASAQLVANFTVDKSGGCSPLSVKFSNTSTGTSAGTTWQWNLGNGNTSALKDPGATYFTEKTYTVILTAKDGATTSSKSITITVYKKPTVDFTVSPAKGCAPLNVSFVANATPGDGSLANYLWDFGDGSTIQGSSYGSTQHIYTSPQVPPITLNITNSFGCYTTVSKSALVEVVTGVQAVFTPSAFTLCNAGESITFNNNSTGSGTLTYAWDFGDAKTSTEKSPGHVYSSSGSFVPKLTTTSSDGCSSTVQSAAINVANFVADFDIPAKICLNQQIGFNNKSTKPFDKAEWYIDNSNYGYSGYNDGSLYTAFYTPGEHTLKLLVYYGTCTATITKTVTVNDLPKLTGFVADLQGACGVPVTINYKDTSSDAVSWQWQNSYFNNATFGSTKNTSFTYTSGDYESVYLTTTNAAGCTTTVGKFVNYARPNINITIADLSSTQGCKPIKIKFTANPDTSLVTYKWNFGDGTTVSTDSTPTHIFNNAGFFTVILSYTTKNGCSGTATYGYITVVDKPVFDFKSSQTTICGNTPDTITANDAGTGWSYAWYFNDVNQYYSYNNSSIIHQFSYDTIYTVKMIAYNNGCSDTVIKTDYLKVLPPFPHIQQVLNICDGTRGDVRFTEDSKKALKWSWNFGDGGTDSYSSFKDTIRHTYNATKAYKVVLSATNAGCTVRDSVTAYVLLKQKPILSSTKADACGSSTVDFRLYNLEKNPYPYYYYNNGYGVQSKEYNDSTPCYALLSAPNPYWDQELYGNLDQLDPGKTSLRMITNSIFFGCADTSNFMPIKIHGPKAGFKQEPHSGCFKEAVRFTDTSAYSGVAKIVKWEWNFGDGKTQTLTASGSVSHLYSEPGTYYVTLKVTDADGCFNSTNYYNYYITVSGPKADFSASSFTVPPNTTVYLNNTSQFYYYYYYTSSAKWQINDSTFSTDDYNTSITFPNAGTYPVKLITSNSITGCPDTIVKNIIVRKVNSAFTYTLSYIGNNSCPPVIANFTSTSTNAVRVSWDFGDGVTIQNNRYPSHTYNKPGLYRVVHYSFDSNIGVDSTEDFIEVKGPYALLKADQLTGCNTLQVKLTAEVKYASDYTWDFGDGTVVPTTDTFAIHNYVTPGIYVPALILKDAGGCTATSELPEKVIVDSLSAALKIFPSAICDSAVSVLVPSSASLSGDQLQELVSYTWVINQGITTDSLHTESVTYNFNKLGIHHVTLITETKYGCQQTVFDSVIVKQGVRASVAAANNICQGDVTFFTGSGAPQNSVNSWKWNFKNGSVSPLQNPPGQQYNIPGIQQISLIVSNGFCSDTAYHSLLVNALPVVMISPAEPFVCKGSSIYITASGGIVYQWSSDVSISNPDANAILISPATSGYYTARVTDAQGCSNKDSVYVKLVSPFKVIASPSLFACQGEAVQLKVSGADKYKWIGNTAGITDLNSGTSSALTNISVTYTVVGYDNYGCFTDTARVAVRISPLPLADAGPGTQLIAGSSFTLSPTVSGAVNYAWSPSTFLSCVSCLNAVSTPKSSMLYTFTAYNADGCIASDTVSVRLICSSNLVFIPNAFSPNGDNVNDRFTITGSGIKSIRSVTIFSRLGSIVFQRKNVSINDKAASWDGTINGEPAMPGAFVYQVQAECEGGEIFNYKGTVLVIR